MNNKQLAKKMEQARANYLKKHNKPMPPHKAEALLSLLSLNA